MPQVPAKRYDLFIKAFEKEVSKVQKSIKKMDCLHKPYEICREYLESLNLDNEIRLELHDRGIYVRIKVLDNDREVIFSAIISNIGSRLFSANLHKDGFASTSESIYDFCYTWRLSNIDLFKQFEDDAPPYIRLTLDVPWDGTKYIKVETKKTIRTIEEEDRRLVWLEIPQPSPSEGF